MFAAGLAVHDGLTFVQATIGQAVPQCWLLRTQGLRTQGEDRT